MRTKVAAVGFGLVVMVVSGCESAARPTSGPTTTAAHSGVATSTTNAPIGVACSASMLRAQTKFGGVGAGNDREVVLLTDIGRDACKVGGYPGLVGVTSSGKHVPLVARHGTYFVDPTPGEITPGSTAELNLGSYGPACQDHTLPDYTSLIVELPAGMGDVAVSQFNMPNAAPGTFMPCELSESQIGVSATSTATPAAAAPCTNEQLSWRASPTHPGDTNDVGALVVITNKSPQACSLAGTPEAIATLSTGATTAVSSGQRIAALPPTAGQPVDRSPGSTA